MSTSSPPSDIIFLILAHLADDPDSLRHTSLVSKSWIYPSQSYLFSTLVISLSNCQPRVPPTDDDEPRNTHPNCTDSYLGLLDQKLNRYGKYFPSTLAVFVRKLVVSSVGRQWLRPSSVRIDPSTPYPYVELGLLKTILHRLLSLRSLTLDMCTLRLAEPLPETSVPSSMGGHDVHSSLITQRPLQELVLSRSRGDVGAFHTFFSQVEVRDAAVSMLECQATGNLRSKTLHRSKSSSNDSNTKALSSFTVHPSFSSIRSFITSPEWRTTRNLRTSTVYTALLGSFTSLAYLDAGCFASAGNGSYYSVQCLLLERGRHLLHLRLDISRRWDYPDHLGEPFYELDLGKHCPSLQTLHIFTCVSVFRQFTTAPPTLDDATSLRSIQALISRANPTTLRKIILGFEVCHSSMTQGFDAILRTSGVVERGVRELDEALTKLGGLEVVEVRDEWGAPSHMKAWTWKEMPMFFKCYMEEKMEKTRERGILHFEDVRTS